MRVISWLWRVRRCPLRAPLRNAASIPNPVRASATISTTLSGVWLIGIPLHRRWWALRAAEPGHWLEPSAGCAAAQRAACSVPRRIAAETAGGRDAKHPGGFPNRVVRRRPGVGLVSTHEVTPF